MCVCNFYNQLKAMTTFYLLTIVSNMKETVQCQKLYDDFKLERSTNRPNTFCQVNEKSSY